MTADWFAGREIVFAMGVVLASWPFGIAAGLLVERPLAVWLGWPAVMDATAVLGGVVLVLVATIYTGPPDAERPAGAPPPSPASWPSWRQLAPVAVAGIIWANANVGLVLFFSFAPDLLREFGFGGASATALPGAALWIVMVATPLGGYVIERLGRPNLAIVLCCALAGGALALLAGNIGPAWQCLAFGLVMGIPAGAVMALPARVLDSGHRAAGFGLFFTIYYALMALGPAAAGWLRDQAGTRSALILAAALFVAVLPLLGLFESLASRVASDGSAGRSVPRWRRPA